MPINIAKPRQKVPLPGRPDAAAIGAERWREAVRSLPDETTGLRDVNVPESDPVNAVLESLGATLTARQHEMALEL